jgi:integrase
MKYKVWLGEWLKNYVKPSVKAKTFERYSEMIAQHIVVGLGDYELEKLSPTILQNFVTALLEHGNLKTGSGLAVSSVNGIITVIQDSLKTATMVGFMNSYIGDKIKRPKAREKCVSCFTPLEQKKIESAVRSCKKNKMLGVLLCLYTGLRIGELLALEWTDINFVRGTLSVTKTCHDTKAAEGGVALYVDTPKTETSVRVIPLPKQLIPLLKDMKRNSKSNRVIAGKNGKIVSVRSYQQSFECLLKNLHIAHKGFHSLRHTFATRAIECGMDIKTLSEILGHKNPTITLNRYAHSLMDHKREMMNKLGKLL